MRIISDRGYREYENKLFFCSMTFFRKSYRLWANVEKYSRAG